MSDINPNINLKTELAGTQSEPLRLTQSMSARKASGAPQGRCNQPPWSLFAVILW